MSFTDDDRRGLYAFASTALPRYRHHMNEMLTRMVESRVVKAGDAVIDAGANAGFHTAHLSEIVGPTGIVHAFEPNPVHWQGHLKRKNVRLWPLAVGDRSSVETFYSAKGFDEIASFHDPRAWRTIDAEMEQLSVVQAPIDSIAEVAARPIGFVKLDVEQHEYPALLGMRALIERDKPVMVVEGANDEIGLFFKACGYQRVELTHAVFGDADPNLPNAIFAPLGIGPNAIAPSEGDVVALIEKLVKEAAEAASAPVV